MFDTPFDRYADEAAEERRAQDAAEALDDVSPPVTGEALDDVSPPVPGEPEGQGFRPRRRKLALCLALLAATGSCEEIPMHVRASRNTGAAPEEIMQAFLHVAVYAGVPKANHAIKLAKRTFAEMGVQP